MDEFGREVGSDYESCSFEEIKKRMWDGEYLKLGHPIPYADYYVGLKRASESVRRYLMRCKEGKAISIQRYYLGETETKALYEKVKKLWVKN